MACFKVMIDRKQEATCCKVLNVAELGLLRFMPTVLFE